MIGNESHGTATARKSADSLRSKRRETTQPGEGYDALPQHGIKVLGFHPKNGDTAAETSAYKRVVLRCCLPVCDGSDA